MIVFKKYGNTTKLKRKVPGAGVEPARPNGHMTLNHACLPIPAPGRRHEFDLRKNEGNFFN